MYSDGDERMSGMCLDEYHQVGTRRGEAGGEDETIFRTVIGIAEGNCPLWRICGQSALLRRVVPRDVIQARVCVIYSRSYGDRRI